MKQWLKNHFKGLWGRLFHLGQRLGFDLLPRHFYSEIPDIAKLRATHPWRKPYTLAGVNGVDVEEQLQFARSTITTELVQRLVRGDIYRSACDKNGAIGYGPVEADFLHAFIVTHQPKHIIQVGSGVSTAICLAAALESGYQPAITCVDPFPTTFLREAAAKGEITLIAKPVETLDPDILSELQPGDLFFVDSSHTLGPAGEVSRLILEFLPQLRGDVYVHFHDILFPYDYAGDILSSTFFFWHESVLLHAFLAYNTRFKILASMSMLHYKKAPEMMELLPSYRPRPNQEGLADGPGHFPSAIYLRVMSA